jgi:hypothetical protein
MDDTDELPDVTGFIALLGPQYWEPAEEDKGDPEMEQATAGMPEASYDIVGPFFTRAEAWAWCDTMRAHAERVRSFPGKEQAEAKWYVQAVYRPGDYDGTDPTVVYSAKL